MARQDRVDNSLRSEADGRQGLRMEVRWQGARPTATKVVAENPYATFK